MAEARWGSQTHVPLHAWMCANSRLHELQTKSLVHSQVVQEIEKTPDKWSAYQAPSVIVVFVVVVCKV
jgi:hypothetical protein